MIMSRENPQPDLCEEVNRNLWADFIKAYSEKFHTNPNPKFWTEEDVAYWLDHLYGVDESDSDAII